MKSKKISLVLFSLVVATLSHAQFKFGAKAGLNFSSMSINDTKTKFGYDGGLYGEYSLNEKSAIQLGFVMTSKGCKFPEEDGVNTKLVLNYGELQPSYIYSFKLNNYNLYASAGVYFTVLATGTIKADKEIFGVNGDSKTQSVNLGNDKENDQLKASDFGLNIGGGIEIEKFGRIGLQYSPGLANLSFNDDETINNSSVSLTWTLPFSFGRKK